VPILLHLAAAGLYAVLAVYFWRTRWANAPADRSQPGAGARGLTTVERGALLLALMLHFALLNATIFVGERMHFGFGLALSTMVWLAAVTYWIESFFDHVDGMQALVLPLAAIGVVLPVLFPASHLLINNDSFLFRAHFIVAMLAYTLFTIAALHATVMAVLEQRLHAGAVSGALASLPPLLTMERTLFRIIWIGFLLLTVTLASGILFSETLFGKPLGLDYKTLYKFGFGLLSWIIFGALLFGRHVYGWRGRSVLRWTLAGFAALLLTYIGTRFVLEVILGRP
jgi:ABC-type uncharacterized transport system permease subunit